MKRWWISAIFATLASGLLVWGLITPDIPLVGSATPPAKALPQTYIDYAIRTQYTEEGVPSHELTITSWMDYEDDDKSYLTEVSYRGIDEKGHFWHMRADTAHYHKQSNELVLLKNVQVRYSGADAQLTSDHLRLLPDSQKAMTQTPIVITTPSSTTTADGLVIDLQSDQAQLLANVETQYSANR